MEEVVICKCKEEEAKVMEEEEICRRMEEVGI
jgi:hypothetical protein